MTDDGEVRSNQPPQSSAVRDSAATEVAHVRLSDLHAELVLLSVLSGVVVVLRDHVSCVQSPRLGGVDGADAVVSEQELCVVQGVGDAVASDVYLVHHSVLFPELHSGDDSASSRRMGLFQ